MTISFNDIKTISFDTLNVNKINREKMAKELFLTTFSTDYQRDKEWSLQELAQDNFLDDFVNSLENLLSEIDGSTKPYPEKDLFEETFKNLIYKSFLSSDFELLKVSTVKPENTVHLY